MNIVKEYWAKRKISEETLRYAGIGQDEHGNTVFHYFDTNDVLCNVKYRPSRKVEKNEKIPKFWTQKDADTMPLLYGMNKVDITQPLLICEGESDYLSILESGFKNVCSVPFGAGYKKVANIEKEMFTWIETNFEWLNQFSKILVLFDNDDVGMKGRKEACTRLGSYRSYFIEVPKELIGEDENNHLIKDISDVYYYCGKQKVLDLINDAHEIPVPGVFDLSTYGDFDIEKAPGLYTGLKSIDNILYKLLYGSVVLLTGERGSGKSTFLNQVFICQALDQGEDVFICSRELSGDVLKNWVETTMLGVEHIEMKTNFIRKFDKDSVKIAREWYAGRIWSYDDIDNDANTILNRAVDITRRYGVKIWILDNLATLGIGVSGDFDQWVKQKDFIVKLISLANTYGVLVILAAHPRKKGGLEINRRLTMDDIAGLGDLSNLAHYIISIHRFTKLERKGEMDTKGRYKKGKEPIKEHVVVDILKNRYTGNTSDAKFYFSYPSYRFYSNKEELYRRYKWDKSTTPLPEFKLPEEIPDLIQD